MQYKQEMQVYKWSRNPQILTITHPLTMTDSLDSKLISYALSIIEHIGFYQGIAHNTSKCKNNANKTILILKTTQMYVSISTWHNFTKKCSNLMQ